MTAPVRRKANHILKIMRDGQVHSTVELGRTWTGHNPYQAMQYTLKRMLAAGLVEMTSNGHYRATEKGIGTEEL